MEKESGKITIDQVAKALGVSKTTVSRAISGKGRIGEATRRRVLEYIEENDYKPSIIARGLAQSKTFNICVLLPENYHLSELLHKSGLQLHYQKGRPHIVHIALPFETIPFL